MPRSDSDGPPPERSARVRPRRQSNVPSVRPARSIDPRFSDLYGSVDMKQFEDNYKFLREQEEEEHVHRKHRIKCLQYAVRRHEREEREPQDESDGEDGGEDDFEVENRGAINQLMFRPLSEVKDELQRLKRESQVYISKSKDRQARARQSTVKKEIIRREAAAVREGKKQRAFIPKRSQLKREVLAKTFDKLEQKGGKGAVDKYIERKAKGRR